MAGGVAVFGLIDVTIFRLIVDRVAKQFSFLRTAFLTINTTGANPSGGGYEDRTTLSQNIDFEIPVLPTAHATDNNFSLASCVTGGVPAWGSMISAIGSHFARVGYMGGYDGYLISRDLRVSDYFNQVYYYCTGSYLLAQNVFSETEDNFGTFRVVDITPPGTYEFIAGVNYGSGPNYYTYKADGMYFAPTLLKVRLITVGGAGPGLGADIHMSLSLLKAGSIIPEVQEVDFTTGDLVGTEVAIGGPTDKYLQVTAMAFADTNLGTVDDKFEIVNVKERVIAF